MYLLHVCLYVHLLLWNVRYYCLRVVACFYMFIAFLSLCSSFIIKCALLLFACLSDAVLYAHLLYARQYNFCIGTRCWNSFKISYTISCEISYQISFEFLLRNFIWNPTLNISAQSILMKFLMKWYWEISYYWAFSYVIVLLQCWEFTTASDLENRSKVSIWNICRYWLMGLQMYNRINWTQVAVYCINLVLNIDAI